MCALAVETEVSSKARRRVLAAPDVCTKPGEIAALLRREGLYSLHLGGPKDVIPERADRPANPEPRHQGGGEHHP